MHEVDEELRTISRRGGHWTWTSQPGITHQDISYFPTHASVTAASSNMQKIKNYSDYHDVDEELVIIPAQGGRWAEAGGAGIAFRAANYTPTTTLNSVASLENKNSLSQ